ncbi:MAG: glycosyltransferase [Bacteroidetes bacterium]|nr:MAG: glycosyltransferase [Bacteroidota bacterium]
MEKAHISIVIPTKNEGKYIGPTLEQFRTLLEPFRLEIIVSDADSKDETPSIVRKYQAEWGAHRVKLVQATGKQNIAIGRNLGAAAATGDILFHTDADVQIPNPEAFFNQILETFKRPEVVAATTPIWVYPAEARLSDQLYHTIMNGVIRLSFPVGVYLAKGECQLVRRSVFERIEGYNETIIAGEDCNLFYRLNKEGKIAYLHRLKVYHSPRRFREYGYIRVSLIYFREGLSLLFLRRSYVDEWKPSR